jgi:hypothetical protein
MLGFTLAGCSTAPVTNLLDHFAPSCAQSGDPAQPPRDGRGPSPPGVFPAQLSPRLGEPVETYPPPRLKTDSGRR